MNILSINFGHDASVAILKDGEIFKYYKEERYSKIKRDSSPFLSIQKCAENFKEKIDYIIIDNLPKINQFHFTYAEKYLCKIFGTNPGNIIAFHQEHHTSHAALSFYNSGFEDSICIVVDGMGSLYQNDVAECETVFCASYPNNFKIVYKNLQTVKTNVGGKNILDDLNEMRCEYNITSSNGGIVNLYNTINFLINESSLENGKSMGLSSYGEKTNIFPNFFKEDSIEVNWDLFHNVFDDNCMYFCKLYEPYKNKLIKKVTKDNYKLYADYAHEIQLQTQESICTLIQKGLDKTDTKNVCICGGYGMNILANKYYMEKFPDVNFYFEPLSDDGGITIGSAKLLHHSLTSDYTIRKLKSTFFHGDHFDLNQYQGEKVTTKNIAELLFLEKSVAVYRCLSESGQRALGNRSILYNALNKECKNIVNGIKNREWYRPFALIVLEEDLEKYFYINSMKKNSFMTIAFDTKEEYYDLLSGIVHVDKTCRVQTVSKEDGYLYDLLTEFKNLSGHGILLNTSFNLAGQPLVESPQDAFQTLKNSSLDYLWFEESNCIFK
jgi:carbamoyltransferase